MDLRNERLAIIEIQQSLLDLFTSGYDIPMITPDGFYSEPVRIAILQFQKLAGIPQNGIVDEITWNTLREYSARANIARAKSVPIYVFENRISGGEIRPGEKWDIIAIMQIMLAALDFFDNYDLHITGTFDEPTRLAVIEFQNAHGFEPTGVVDKQTWNALAVAYNNSIIGENQS